MENKYIKYKNKYIALKQQLGGNWSCSYCTFSNHDFLNICEKYLQKKDIYNYLECIDMFEKFIYSIPIYMSKEHYLKKKELTNILKNLIKEPKQKMIEMQTFIPYNYYNYTN